MAKPSSINKVTLQDGTEVELRPLNIKLFRKFQERWTEMIENSGDLDVLDRVDDLIDLAVICVSREIGENATNREWLEDVLDFDIIYTILKDCADVDLKPTNVVATATAAVSGQTSI
jgi:hypothetical protein